MHITFLGAAQMVTGSCFLVEAGGKRLLIDCGLPQGNDEKECGTDLAFDAVSIDYLVVTHAHIDHTGRIPLLVKALPVGSRTRPPSTSARSYSPTAATSGRRRRSGRTEARRAGQPAVEPPTVEDAQKAMAYFERCSTMRSVPIVSTCRCAFAMPILSAQPPSGVGS